MLAKVEAHRAHMDQVHLEINRLLRRHNQAILKHQDWNQLPEFMSLLAQAIGKHSAYEEQEIYPLYQPKKGKHP